jgi:hypothetical protein
MLLISHLSIMQKYIFLQYYYLRIKLNSFFHIMALDNLKMY